MPRLTRWFLKSSLLYLAAALLLGVVVTAGVPPAAAAALRPVQLHLLSVGWVTQMIFGVAYWMFPRHSRERPYRSEGLGWAVYVLLNAGLLARAVAEPLHGARGDDALGVLLIASALLQSLAVAGFIWNTWGRVRER